MRFITAGFICAQGNLRYPNYSWDPNWATCTNKASESSNYKNGNFLCPLYFFPLQPAQPSRPPGSFTPLSRPRLTSTRCLPLLSNLKGAGIIFSHRLRWILLCFSPPLGYKRFYAFWVWPLLFLLGKLLPQQECWCRNNLRLLTSVFRYVVQWWSFLSAWNHVGKAP